MPQNGRTGTNPVAPHSLTGRGIWMVRELSDAIDINTGPTGTTVTVVVYRVSHAAV
jgi:hypothetical protein